MELGLRARHVLVTGGTRGMGQAIAVPSGREHARVALPYHEDAAAAKDVAGKVEAVGGEAVVVRLDLAERASIEHAVASVSDQFGGLDVLVAHAIRVPTDASGPIADTGAQGGGG